MKAEPRVFVCVPTRKSGEHAPISIASLKRQDYSNFEVVYSMEQGDPHTEMFREFVNGDPRFHVLETKLVKKPGRNANELRNAAAKYVIDRLAKGVEEEVILIFTDMKITHPSDWISRGVEYRQSQEIEAVGGVMLGLPEEQETFTQRFWRLFTDLALLTRNPRVAVPYVINKENFGSREDLPITATLLLTKAYFVLMGGFNNRFRDSYEDYEADWRLVKNGGRIFFTGGWYVYHKHRSSFQQIRREYTRSGRGAGQLFATHPDCPYAIRRAKQVATVLFFGAASLFFAFILLISQIWWLLAAGISFVVLSLLAAGVLNAVKARRWQAILFPTLTAYFIVVFSVGFAIKILEGGGETKSNRFLQTVL